MWQQKLRQMRLFEEDKPVHLPRPLHKEVAQQATHELAHWIKVLAKAVGTEAGDEQNKR
jgi:hypothetical protein